MACIVGTVGFYYGSAVFERFAPHWMLRRFQRSFGNPFGRKVMRRLPGWAVIETTGRRTGQPRSVPVGGRLIGTGFCFVVAEPQNAAYMRNIEANPRVRVQVAGQWRRGTAEALLDDNPRKTMFRVNPLNGLFIWIAARNHLTIRVDLDPAAA